MNYFDSFMYRWFPKRHIKKMIRTIEGEQREKRKAASSLPLIDRQNLNAGLHYEIQEWVEMLESLQDKDLFAKAKLFDVDILSIQNPEPDEFQRPGHWKIGTFGNEVLYPESRRALELAIRERKPLYYKERADKWDVVIKTTSAFTGLGGVAVALLSLLLTKCSN